MAKDQSLNGVVPKIHYLPEAAALLRVSRGHLRSKLRDGTFAGLKLAGKWAMTGHENGYAVLWDVETGKPVRRGRVVPRSNMPPRNTWNSWASRVSRMPFRLNSPAA